MVMHFFLKSKSCRMRCRRDSPTSCNHISSNPSFLFFDTTRIECFSKVILFLSLADNPYLLFLTIALSLPHAFAQLPSSLPALRRLGSTNLADTTSTLGDTSAETVLELPGNLLERSHAAGSGGLSALGLLTPLDCVKDCVSQRFFIFNRTGLRQRWCTRRLERLTANVELEFFVDWCER